MNPHEGIAMITGAFLGLVMYYIIESVRIVRFHRRQGDEISRRVYLQITVASLIAVLLVILSVALVMIDEGLI